ncbi:hypothetical protein ABZT04_27270 [Streptomyces sp. NPDC005492]|uniref:hypothetical protein n=1 Tax=Streptomyces sp. NPDC005492 TaxID=3156883 RepID=UPI0033B6773C
MGTCPGRDREPLEWLRQLVEETGTGQQGCGTALGCPLGNPSLGMVDAVVGEARDADVTVTGPREAARAVVAQLADRVVFAKLCANTGRLSPRWANCRAPLGACAA